MKAKKIVALVLALVMVLALGTTALAATGDMSNPVTAADLNLYFGDPDYPATAPECYMYFKETGTNTYDAIYSTNGTTASTSFYPSILAFYVIPVKGANGQPVTTVTSITGTDMDFVTYDEETGAETVSTTATVNEKGFYTIKPKSSSSKIVINGTVTVNFSAPMSSTAAPGSIAKAVCGYPPSDSSPVTTASAGARSSPTTPTSMIPPSRQSSSPPLVKARAILLPAFLSVWLAATSSSTWVQTKTVLTA